VHSLLASAELVDSPGRLAVIACIVLVLAAVQSVFGVGLLVFGTPTLLLMGLPFPVVLGCLLPCSIVVSTAQVATSGGVTLEPIRRTFLRLTAPAVVAGTLVALALGTKIDLRLLVGVMLLLTAALRVSEGVRTRISAVVTRRLGWFALALGVLHGLTNLGGGVLTVIVASAYRDKADVRRHIAFCYGLMAILQLAVVELTTPPGIPLYLYLALPAVALASYWLVGRLLFRLAGQSVYQGLLTLLIGGFGAVLVATA
jgi:hypothetical protein